ncbi:hypothetical protein V2J09_005588 [Rumex salicifolius]
MASPEASQTNQRISFSVDDFLNEADFISITPNSQFNNGSYGRSSKMLSNAELLPCTQIQSAVANRPRNISLKKSVVRDDQKKRYNKTTSFGDLKLEEPGKWFNADDEPSPRPPKCTVLWKELLRLRKQRASSSVSSSSAAKSSSFPASFPLKKGGAF